MREQFFTQTEWLGIQFRDLDVPLDSSNPATSRFYDSFYTEVMRRYGDLIDLPGPWLEAKVKTANCLASLLGSTERVLSFGSGMGIIEGSLVRERGFSDLWLWDFAHRDPCFWPELQERFLTGWDWPDTSNAGPFDAIYLVQVLYALPADGASETLRRLSDLLVPGGRIVVMETSLDEGENRSITSVGKTSRFRSLSRARNLARRFGSLSRSKQTGTQGWGWLRDNDCIAGICKKAGLKVISAGPCANQTVLVATRQDHIVPQAGRS